MNLDELKNEIHERSKYYLQKDKSGKGYICPICGSGTGKNGTGITTKDNIHYTCWKGCYTSTDIIDIIGMQYGLSEYKDKIEKACSLMGITIYEQQITNNTTAANVKNQNETHNATERTEMPQNEPKTNYKAFYNICVENAPQCDYLQNRGISIETQLKYNIGYCENWINPKNDKCKPTPRIIIPTSDYSYAARYVGDNENVPKMIKAGGVNIFNLEALYSGYKPVFVVEGEIDALSIIEVGYDAIALGGVTMANKLINTLKEKNTKSILILAMDNDDAGREATETLEKGFDELGVLYTECNLGGKYKDANEILQADRESFINYIKSAIKTADEYDKARLRDMQQKESCEHYIDGFLNGIEKSVDTPFISTGFDGLDHELDGGLYEGFYVLGAISSLGKTTLALQIADNIAAADDNTDVLIFSLEMARNELIAKSISRLTAKLCIERELPLEYAKTIRGITVKKFYNKYSTYEKDLIQDACQEYKKYSKNIYIYEGVGNIAAEQIRQAIELYRSKTDRYNRKIVAIIDYLQILAPYDNKSRTDKQNVDMNITAIKRICRDMKIPIIGISSLNRNSYKEAVTMSAFKESGSIEYSSDVLMGLQFKGVGDKDFDVDKAKAEMPRELVLKILKNRNGRTGGEIEFSYYPQFNYFTSSQDWQKADGNPFE